MDNAGNSVTFVSGIKRFTLGVGFLGLHRRPITDYFFLGLGGGAKSITTLLMYAGVTETMKKPFVLFLYLINVGIFTFFSLSFSAHCLIMSYICTKFNGNIFYGFQTTDQSEFQI